MSQFNFKPLPSCLSQKQRDNLWGKVDRRLPHECWPWLGSIGSSGYPEVWINNESYTATRIAYLDFYGKQPSDMCVCHSCDNPPCMNPYHFVLGDNDYNMKDRQSKGRQYKGERHHWAKLSEHDVLCILRLQHFLTSVQTAAIYGVSKSLVKGHLARKQLVVAYRPGEDMKILGLGTYSRVGKDSLANYLVEALKDSGLRVAKRSFAWKLKDITHQLYGWAGMREAEFYETKEGAPYRDIKLSAIGKTPVEIWVDMGTPAIRECVYDRTWIDYLLKGSENLDVLIIPDVRFPNEVEAIRDEGGTLAKIVRPGYGPRKTVADRALLGYAGWDYVLGQSGTMSELEDWAVKFADMLVHGKPVVQSDDGRASALAVEVVEPWEQVA